MQKQIMNKKIQCFFLTSSSLFFSQCEKQNNNFITLELKTPNQEAVELYVEVAHKPSNDYFSSRNIYDTCFIKKTHTFFNIIPTDRLNIYINNDKLPIIASLTGKIDENIIHKKIIFSAQDNVTPASSEYIISKNTKLFKYTINFHNNGEISHLKHHIFYLAGETYANQMHIIQPHDKNAKE